MRQPSSDLIMCRMHQVVNALLDMYKLALYNEKRTCELFLNSIDLHRIGVFE